MDKDIIANYNHTISITERKNINISGVKKIESFDNEEFLLETTMGFIIIKGEGLEIIKLDTYTSKEKANKKSTHCGFTPNEMEVPLIVIDCK